MNIHAAAGLRYGISAGDIDRLIRLDPSHFDYREWLVLKYAQEWASSGGRAPTGGWVNDYQRQYSRKYRARIDKLLRVMQFANYWNNMMRKKPYRDDIEGLIVDSSCETRGPSTRDVK